MRRGVAVWLAVGIAVLAGGVGYAALDRPSHVLPDVELAMIDRGTITRTITATGTVNAVGLVQVGSPVSGQIQSLNADYNSIVEAGLILAQINPEGFAARVAEAAAQRDVAAASILTAQAQLDRARADAENSRARLEVLRTETRSASFRLDQARRDQQRIATLSRNDLVSASERERVQSALDQGNAALAGAKAQESAQETLIEGFLSAVRAAEAEVMVAEATLKQREAVLAQAKVELERTTIRAPIDGIVIDRNVDVGQTVAASLEAPVLFTLARDLRRLQVETFVDEADIGSVREGQSVTFHVAAFPGERFAGTVIQVRKAPQVIQNVVSYVVVIAATNDDLRLLPGMTATVSILVEERRDVLRVPGAALRFRPDPGVPPAAGAPRPQRRPDEGQVYVMDKAGAFAAVPVRLGISDSSFTEIHEGDLTEGQPVVTGRRRKAGT